MADTTMSGTQQASGAPKIGEELSGDVAKLKETAASKAEEMADGGKQQATSAAHAVSSAMEKAADALQENADTPDWLRTAFQKTARQVEQLASNIEGKDVADIRRSVSDFARQSPTAFLAASAAAGFAAARFLRAGSEYQGHQQNASTGQGGGIGGYGATGQSGFESAQGSGGGMTGSSGGFTPGSTGSAGSEQGVWTPSSAPLDREGVVS